MNVALRLGGERIFVWFVIVLGIVASCVFGFMVGEHAVGTAVVFFSILGALAWVALARRKWWLIVPAASGIGGYFYFGYKFHTHEVALLAAFVPLALSIAVRVPGTSQKRSHKFPMAMYFLSFYLFAHWLGSNIYNRLEGEGGYGNVTRAYFNTLWVILFVIAFWFYGSTKYVRPALLIGYIATFARLFIGLLTYFSNAFAYIPIINYVLPGSTHTRGSDLRASAFALGLFSATYFLVHKGFVKRFFHGGVFFCSFVALLFGGGRGALILLCLIPISIALLYRKIVPIFLSLVIGAGLLGVLNFNPDLLNDLPYSVQRSVSVLILDKDVANSYGRTATSDLWHEELRRIGFKNWTSSWHTFLFGTGIRPFVPVMYDQVPTFEDLLEASSKVGAYESGWWTVMAVTGLLGLILYLIVFGYLLRQLVPILWKERIIDARHAFAFAGVFGMINWLVLGWANGGFPSTEILYGFIAVCAFQDRLQARKKDRPASMLPAPRIATADRPSRAMAR